METVLPHREIAVIIALIIVAVVASMSIRKFSSPLTLRILLLDVTPILLIALPMALILISAEIDLSVARHCRTEQRHARGLVDDGHPLTSQRWQRWCSALSVEPINGFLVTVVGLPSSP